MFKVVFILALQSVKFNVLKKVWEVLRYVKKSSTALLPDAELLSIAVVKDYRGKGVSKELFNALVKGYISIGIKRFRIVVGNSLAEAHRFYEKMGCVEVGKLEVHKSDLSKVYLFEIKQYFKVRYQCK